MTDDNEDQLGDVCVVLCTLAFGCQNFTTVVLLCTVLLSVLL